MPNKLIGTMCGLSSKVHRKMATSGYFSTYTAKSYANRRKIRFFFGKQLCDVNTGQRF